FPWKSISSSRCPPPGSRWSRNARAPLPLVPCSMVLRESPFPNRLLSGLYSLGQYLLFPSYWAADCLLDLRETTAERQQRRCCRCCPLRALVTGPLLLLLLILSMPGALLGLLLWLPMQVARRPFAYKHNMLSRHPEVWELPGTGKVFSFVSANVCLLPNGLAKNSNLGQMKQRAARIGQCLTQGEASASFASPRSSQFDGEREAGPREISVPFPPDVDFVCLQEVFDQRAGAHLCQLLSPFYEHIVYNVGAYGLQGCCTLKVLSSGLFLASRYPVLAAQYCCYPNGIREDALSAKGLLSVQVRSCSSCGEPRPVTEPCPLPAHAQIRCDQLTMGLSWVQLFQDTHAQRGDVVAFDVFCGDFNFDNCSSGDELEQTHEIFRQYQDPCRVGPRQDRPWAIGTFRSMLEAEGFTALVQGRLCPWTHTGSPWEGRRIDYILYREHPTTISLTTEVEKFSFITQLAGCSDHVAVGLQLLLNPAPQ
uniref:sphingomyelin phosphodiesterase n=1 Tax=Gopherus agassizii TaxID=38772 RepID=A0A452HG55_9SAUR